MRARHLPDWVRVPESVSGTTASFDGYLSSDGPFGVFAHPVPNETHTIIGGPDLVAVDWVGASKMGIDPLLSPAMLTCGYRGTANTRTISSERFR